ncbi:phosphate ABC transporter periplasmic substrate-binding protein PstS [Tatumella ptyseos]|uniref:Phosphate ABC transporter periplasmic substrate-binding protein PstS n=1 Tax=Tatumella ptyseos TaxID=82987 RepID=A0A2X5PKS7_9GAMM|nr:phosphate ABC transporter periplasmic substrate-binding protein PstS [Tatumella ptyseos]
MTLMHKTVARVLAATLSLSAVSAFAATNLTGAGGTFPARYMPAGLRITRKRMVVR